MLVLRRSKNVASAKAVEAHAAIFTINFAKEIGIKKVVVEGDAKGILEGIETTTHDLSSTGNFIEDTRSAC